MIQEAVCAYLVPTDTSVVVVWTLSTAGAAVGIIMVVLRLSSRKLVLRFGDLVLFEPRLQTFGI